MKESSLCRLLYTDFDIRNITVYPVLFSGNTGIDHTVQPREKNLLHLITSGSRVFTVRGRTIALPTGSLVLIPDRMQYASVSCCEEGENCSGVGVCFDLFLPDGSRFQIEPEIYHNWNLPRQQYEVYISRLQEAFQATYPSVLETKILLYRLLHSLIADMAETTESYSVIEPAIRYITDHYTRNLPVKVYADRCRLSESYFRKKFTECMGMSPIEYRNRLRFETARRLYQEKKSLQEIAELTGFCDEKYFAKAYKKANGSTLKDSLNML